MSDTPSDTKGRKGAIIWKKRSLLGRWLLILSFALAAVIVASMTWEFRAWWKYESIAIGGGMVTIELDIPRTAGVFYEGFASDVRAFRGNIFQSDPVWFPRSRSAFLSLPDQTVWSLGFALCEQDSMQRRVVYVGLAPIALAIGVSGLTILVWRAIHVRRTMPWQCRKCRYDLRGLSAGAVCPECGTARRG